MQTTIEGIEPRPSETEYGAMRKRDDAGGEG
jgi:hypothetical protein